MIDVVVDNDNGDKTRSFSKRSKPDLRRFFFRLRKHSAYRRRLNDLLPSAAVALSRIVFTTEQEIWVLEPVTPPCRAVLVGSPVSVGLAREVNGAHRVSHVSVSTLLEFL